MKVTNALPKIKIPTLSVAQLKDRLGGVIVLDVRAKALYEMGSIKGSLKIPLGHLSQKYTEIPKDKKIVVVDHAGKQVLTAAKFLKSKGYENVHRLQGGTMAWINKGLPLEK